MSNSSLRPAHQSDAAALAACFDRAYAEYRSRITDLPAVSEGIAEDIMINKVWVAEDETGIVGGLVLVFGPEQVTVANVAVDPKATGTGLGRAFMECAESEARRQGLNRLRLSTHVDLPENVRLYAHLGWRETGRVGNKVHMEKVLTA